MGIQNIKYNTEFSLTGITGQPSEIGAYLASIFPIFFLGTTLNWGLFRRNPLDSVNNQLPLSSHSAPILV